MKSPTHVIDRRGLRLDDDGLSKPAESTSIGDIRGFSPQITFTLMIMEKKTRPEDAPNTKKLSISILSSQFKFNFRMRSYFVEN